jgi:hypothetical protein
MNENVKAFMISQGLTERDIEYRGNFTFLKVELMLLQALKQGQTLPIDNVVGQSEQLKPMVFELANKLAIAGEGDAAVSMHRIHNRL